MFSCVTCVRAILGSLLLCTARSCIERVDVRMKLHHSPPSSLAASHSTLFSTTSVWERIMCSNERSSPALPPFQVGSGACCKGQHENTITQRAYNVRTLLITTASASRCRPRDAGTSQPTCAIGEPLSSEKEQGAARVSKPADQVSLPSALAARLSARRNSSRAWSQWKRTRSSSFPYDSACEHANQGAIRATIGSDWSGVPCPASCLR